MTEAQAYAAGQRDGFDNKPPQTLAGKHLNSIYQFGRRVGAGLLTTAVSFENSTRCGK